MGYGGYEIWRIWDMGYGIWDMVDMEYGGYGIWEIWDVGYSIWDIGIWNIGYGL